MSSEMEALAFLDSVKSEEDLKQHISTLSGSMDGILGFAQALGYNLSADDLRKGYTLHATQHKPSFDLSQMKPLSITSDYLAVYMCDDNTTSGCNDCNTDSYRPK